NQAPHLAAGDGPAAFESRLRPELALPECVAVGLVVIRGNTRRQEVTLEVAADFNAIELSGNSSVNLGLSAGKVQVIHVGVGGAGERNSLEVCVHVVGDGTLAINTFSRHEAAGRNRDSLEADLIRIGLVFIRGSNEAGRKR